MSQTCAAEYFKSRAEVLFARLHSFRFRSRSFCCCRFRSTPGGILLSVLLPVLRIAGAPFSRTVAAPFAVFGIGGDLFFVVVGAPLLLAPGFAADDMAGLKLRRLENLLTVAATPFTHIKGVVSPREDSGLPAAVFRNCCRVPTASPPMAQL